MAEWHTPRTPTGGNPGEEEDEGPEGPEEWQDVMVDAPAPIVDDELLERPGRRNLKLEATGIVHLMTHFPKNKHCPACQGSKMQCPPGRVGALKKRPRGRAFGDLVTVDHAC